MLATLAACAGASVARGNPLGAAPAPAAGLSLSDALVLGASGTAPGDTTVTFPAGAGQTIVLRHPAPENLVFAELAFPPGAFAGDSSREVTVRVRPRPGLYGLDVETSAPIGAGATVTFHYARFFSAPPAARQVYGTDVAFERALAVARVRPDSTLVLLRSTRPAPDNLAAPLPGAGGYVVAAAR